MSGGEGEVRYGARCRVRGGWGVCIFAIFKNQLYLDLVFFGFIIIFILIIVIAYYCYI